MGKTSGMSEKLEVPNSAVEAACKLCLEIGLPLMSNHIRMILEAGFESVAENPPVPTVDQWREILAIRHYGVSMEDTQFYIAEWERRRFRKRELEVPDAVKDLIGEQNPPFPPGKYQWLSLETQRERILEAYRRGQKSAEAKR